ncbi:hypothetical protein Rifp1Sym_bq00180 [endosymbiont of Riftia pachyptila (vent Ph05)]|uniref:Uncharacterized protein n=1 Tax=endosymbiont of Riftia pachyptila (vent Ph05) TaxID=1048808 RepID=G2DDR9_9GAMM|nr:hypothetical protein Rifp1Sym_bq00180 [endosymbiont of Riftia pachyptila (vent Ph05)]
MLPGQGEWRIADGISQQDFAAAYGLDRGQNA